jgi:hypothetical protein
MNGPVDEIRRLRGELADKDRELTELRGLVQQHVEATAGDEQRALDREREAFDRGRDVAQLEYEDGFRTGHDVGLGAYEEARPYVAGIREGFEAGKATWREVAEPVFAHLHQRQDRQAEVEDDLELGA